MLHESLREYLKVTEYCVQFRKNPQEWEAEGCYGYPAAVMLFCILDAIGSYRHGREEFKVQIDGKEKSINNDGFQFFYVLNSKYYKQSLSESDITRLYNNYRCLLMHNGAIAFGHFLISNSTISEAFPILNDGVRGVNLYSFLALSKGAVSMFLDDIDQIVPGSTQAEIIKKKDTSGRKYVECGVGTGNGRAMDCRNSCYSGSYGLWNDKGRGHS